MRTEGGRKQVVSDLLNNAVGAGQVQATKTRVELGPFGINRKCWVSYPTPPHFKLSAKIHDEVTLCRRVKLAGTDLISMIRGPFGLLNFVTALHFNIQYRTLSKVIP